VKTARSFLAGFALGLSIGASGMGFTMNWVRVYPLEYEAVKRGYAEFASPDPFKRVETQFRWLDKPVTPPVAPKSDQ
jgi:hypothetical protein